MPMVHFSLLIYFGCCFCWPDIHAHMPGWLSLSPLLFLPIITIIIVTHMVSIRFQHYTLHHYWLLIGVLSLSCLLPYPFAFLFFHQVFLPAKRCFLLNTTVSPSRPLPLLRLPRLPPRPLPLLGCCLAAPGCHACHRWGHRHCLPLRPACLPAHCLLPPTTLLAACLPPLLPLSVMSLLLTGLPLPATGCQFTRRREEMRMF